MYYKLNWSGSQKKKKSWCASKCFGGAALINSFSSWQHFGTVGPFRFQIPHKLATTSQFPGNVPSVDSLYRPDTHRTLPHWQRHDQSILPSTYRYQIGMLFNVPLWIFNEFERREGIGSECLCLWLFTFVFVCLSLSVSFSLSLSLLLLLLILCVCLCLSLSLSVFFYVCVSLYRGKIRTKRKKERN